MTGEQECLLGLLARALFGAPTDAEPGEGVLAEARAQAVSGLVGPRDYRALAANVRVAKAHADLTGILEGIPFTTFKGWASASYYPDPWGRSLGDVDLIAADGHREEAASRLLAAGWRRCGPEHVRHEGFTDGRVEAELHYEIKGVPNGADGIATSSVVAEARVRSLLAGLIPTSVVADTEYGPVVVTDDLHHGLVMLLHVAGHMVNGGGVGLRHLCDWAVYAGRADVGSFRQELEHVGLWTFARQLTAVSTRYLGLPEKSWAENCDGALLEVLIEDVLSAGNFGRRDGGRSGALAAGRTSLASVVAERTRRRFPVAENRLLLPLLVPAYLADYGYGVVTGRRKPVKPSTIAAGRERAELYRQFRLFEV